MRRLPTVLLPLSLPLAALVPASAAAGPLGFSDQVRVGGGIAGQTAGAVSADGHVGLAWTARYGRGEHLRIALRDGAGRRWRRFIPRAALEIRDPQTAVTPAGDVIFAWAELDDRGRSQDVAVVSAPGAGRLGRIRRFPVQNAFSAAPRLATLRSGAVLLAFRDGRHGSRRARLRVAVRPAGSNRFRDPRTVAEGAGGVALAAAGEGAVVAWPTALPRGRRDRTLYARRLGAAGSAVGRRLLVSRAAAGEVRVAGAPDGRWMVSWIRPGRGGDRPPALFTRPMSPGIRPARPLVAPSGRPVGRRPAALLLTQGAEALAAATTFSLDPFGFGVFTARSLYGGVWTRRQDFAAPGTGMVGDPRLLSASGEALAVWSTAVPPSTASPPARFVTYDVLAARRAPGSRAFDPPQRLGGDLVALNGSGVVAVAAGDRALVAWPAPAGGLAVVERAG